MSTVIDAGHFLLANQLVSAALQSMGQGFTVTQFQLQQQTTMGELDVDKGTYTEPDFLHVEFEICIRSLGGKKVPRVTEAQAKKATASRGVR